MLAFPLWGDEAFLATSILSRDLLKLSLPLDFGQVAPPGFLWGTWASVGVFGRNEYALRLLPFLAGSAALLLFWRTVGRTGTRRVALLAVALLAASYYPARHGNEVKPYTLDLLVGTALLSLGWSVWRSPGQAGRWWCLIGAATAGIWLSYPAIFPAASVGLLLVSIAVRHRSPAFGVRVATYGIMTGTSFLTVALTFARTQSQSNPYMADHWSIAFPPLENPLRLIWWLLDVHAGNMLAYPHGGKNFGSFATLLLVILGVVAVARKPQRRILIWLTLGPLVPAMIAAGLKRYPYGTSARVMLYMAPGFCLLAAEGLLLVCRHLHTCRRGPILIAGALAVLPVAFCAYDVAVPHANWDDELCRQAVREVAARTRPGDRWVVYDGATPPPRGYPDIMMSMWIQRVAEFRANVLLLGPALTFWEHDGSPVDDSSTSPSAGRTWLLAHFHGLAAIYPRDRLFALAGKLAREYGPPAIVVKPLPQNATITVLRYGKAADGEVDIAARP